LLGRFYIPDPAVDLQKASSPRIETGCLEPRPQRLLNMKKAVPQGTLGKSPSNESLEKSLTWRPESLPKPEK
jgi:hypothetical protein